MSFSTAHEAVIGQIETWACSLPLAQALDFGAFQVFERHYVAMRIRTDDGLTADCVSQSRGSPLDLVAAELIAPRLVGKQALEVSALRQELHQSLAALELDGAIGRAWSLAEICLQDLRAQAAGCPLWRLLGGRAQPLQVQLVEGYALADEPDGAFAERLAARTEEGFERLKVEAAHYVDIADVLRMLAAFRKVAGSSPRLVLDFAWSWRDAKRRFAFVDALDELGVDWIEDPFPRERIADYKTLRNAARTAIGCGDEATRPADLEALIDAEAIDVLRLDATTIGGIEVARELSSLALRRGLRVSFHEHPEVHEHCIFGSGCADHIEVFPVDRPFDRAHDLLRSNACERIADGVLQPTQEPGTGIRLRDDALARWAKRHTVVREERS